MPPDTSGAVRPTLFIGLGGTGKEVLLRLRRRFYERWREVGLPCVSYLWLDTDARDTDSQGEELDEIDKLLRFQEFETVPLLTGSVGSDLNNILHEKSRFRYIHEWLPDEVESYGTQVKDGAGGVRSIGRLALVKSFPRVRNAIQQALLKIKTDAVKAEIRQKYLPDVDFDPAPQIYILFSVAGGTGGGTFLDVSFLLSQMGYTDTVGIAVLPNVYHTAQSGLEGKRSLANAYGAMKEIEHFMKRLAPNNNPDGNPVARDLDVSWEDRDTDRRKPGPPFSVLYLCEKIDDRGGVMASRHELFHMIAESLFLNFLPGQFSTAKRSSFANAQQHLAGKSGDTLPFESGGIQMSLTNVFSCRYGCMGMAKIEVPTESIREACAANLASDIVRYWNRPPGDPNLTKRVDEDSLDRFDLEGIQLLFGKDYLAEIDTKWNEVLDPGEQFAGPHADVARMLSELSGKVEKAHLFLFEDAGQDPAHWGRVKKLLRNSVKSCSDKLEVNLRAWAAQRLDTAELGLAALVEDTSDTKGMIPLLMTNMARIYKPFSATSGTPPSEAPYNAEARALQARLDADYYLDIQENLRNELIAVHASTSIGLLAVRHWTLARLWKKYRDAVDQHWKCCAEAILAREARIVAERSEKPLQDLMVRLTRFRNSLEKPQTLLATLQEEYLDFSKGVRSVRIFNRKNDYPGFYRLGFDPERKEHLSINATAESQRFASEKIKDDGRTMDIVEFASNGGTDQMLDRLRDYTSERFQNDFNTCTQHDCHRMVEVLNHRNVGDINQVAQQLVENAAPMLNTGQDADAPGRLVQAYLSVPETESPDYKEFIKRVNAICASRGYSEPRAFATGDKTKIQLLVEKYAFTLDKIPAIIAECRPEYTDFYQQRIEAEMKQFRIPLHIDKRWEGELEDILPIKEADLPVLRQAMEILSVGAVLGVVRAKNLNGRRRYSYNTHVAVSSQTVELGPRRQALDHLTSNEKLRSGLFNAVAERHQHKKQMAASSDPAQRAHAGKYVWALAYASKQVLTRDSPEISIVNARIGEMTEILKAESPNTDEASLAGKAEEELGIPENLRQQFPVQDTSFILNQPSYVSQTKH